MLTGGENAENSMPSTRFENNESKSSSETDSLRFTCSRARRIDSTNAGHELIHTTGQHVLRDRTLSERDCLHD